MERRCRCFFCVFWVCWWVTLGQCVVTILRNDWLFKHGYGADNYCLPHNRLSSPHNPIVCSTNCSHLIALRGCRCRRGLMTWKSESHQVLHIDCWVIAEPEIISSRTKHNRGYRTGCVTSFKYLCSLMLDRHDQLLLNWIEWTFLFAVTYTKAVKGSV